MTQNMEEESKRERKVPVKFDKHSKTKKKKSNDNSDNELGESITYQ